jgi:hypothetical protein
MGVKFVHGVLHHGLNEGQKLVGADSNHVQVTRDIKEKFTAEFITHIQTAKEISTFAMIQNVRQVGIANGVEYLVGVVNRQPMRRIASHQSAHQFLRCRRRRPLATHPERLVLSRVRIRAKVLPKRRFSARPCKLPRSFYA